jgi:hypothetical protein
MANLVEQKTKDAQPIVLAFRPTLNPPPKVIDIHKIKKVSRPYDHRATQIIQCPKMAKIKKVPGFKSNRRGGARD